MSIDIGDAVLSFIADTTQLDAAFAKVGTEAPAKMGAATAAFDATGVSVQGLAREMAVGQQGAVELGEVTNLAGERVKESMYQARGTAGLLGEEFNIHLPRHVRSFIAELPGVGEALSAAFTATAVLFLIQALIEGVEHIVKWAEKAHEVALAWEKVDETQRKVFLSFEDDLLKAGIRVDELTGQHLDALLKKLQLIDNVSLEKLISELTKVQAEADKAFDKMDVGKFEKFFGFLGGIDVGSGKVKEQFDEITKSVDKALSAHTPEAYAAALKLVEEELGKTDTKLADLHKQQVAFDAQTQRQGIGRGIQDRSVQPVDATVISSYEKLRQLLQGYTKDIEEAQKAEQKEKQVAGLEEKKREAQDAKKALDEQLKVLGNIVKAHEALEKQLEKENQQQTKIDDNAIKKQLKGEEEAAKEKLRLLKEYEEAAIVATDGEIKDQERQEEREELLLKRKYETGRITGQQYLADLKALHNAELADLIALLNQKERLVILEAQNEAAMRGKILSDADAKELKGFQAVEQQKKALVDKFEKDYAKAEDQIQRKTLDTFKLFKEAGQQELDAFGAAIAGAIAGQQSFGAAMEAGTLKVISTIAQQWAAYYFGMAIADYWWNPPRAAGELAAAIALEAVAGAASGGASAIGSSSRGGSSGGAASSSGSGSTIGTASQPTQNPVSVVNAQHFDAGGLVSTPTLSVIGHGREAVLPLDDHRAITQIADAIADRIHLSGGGATVHNWNVQGMISADNLNKVAKKISHGVGKGTVRFNASNSLRVTKRG